MPNDEEKTISFQYKISPNFSMYVVSGIHGGLNAKGNVVANFFSERMSIPKEETYRLQKDGHLNPKPIKSDKVDAIIRDVMFGISMDAGTARSIADWLNRKADQFEKRVALIKEKSKNK